MNDNSKDDLHEVLAQMADGVEMPEAEQTHMPSDLVEDDPAGHDLTSPPEVSPEVPPEWPLAPRVSALAPARRPWVRSVFAVVLLVVGGLLLGWAVYGLRILNGAVALDREDAEFMAKLMIFAGGPIGLALVVAGTFGLWRRRGRSTNTQ